jgi:hypothetical protein
MRPIGCPETSVRIYHYFLCNSSKDSIFFLKTFSLRGKIPEAVSATESSISRSGKYPRHIFKVDQSLGTDCVFIIRVLIEGLIVKTKKKKS